MSDFYLFRNAIKDLLRVKKLVAALVLMALPTTLGLLMRFNTSGKDFVPKVAYNDLSNQFIFGFILVILAVVFGTGVIAQEVEQKTIVYLLTRPIPRWRILLAKFAAAVVVTTATAWITSLLVAIVTYGPGGLGASPLGRDLLILPIGALAYTGLFLLIATVLNRPLMYGLLFAFGWETWVPSLAGNFQKLSLIAYLHVLAPHSNKEPETLENSLNQVLQQEIISSRLAWSVLLGTIVVTVLAACLLFSIREYAPRDDAE